jgi:hypothetical protein
MFIEVVKSIFIFLKLRNWIRLEDEYKDEWSSFYEKNIRFEGDNIRDFSIGFFTIKFKGDTQVILLKTFGEIIFLGR